MIGEGVRSECCGLGSTAKTSTRIRFNQMVASKLEVTGNAEVTIVYRGDAPGAVRAARPTVQRGPPGGAPRELTAFSIHAERAPAGRAAADSAPRAGPFIRSSRKVPTPSNI